METVHFGNNRSAINLVYAPRRIVIDPRIIDKTRWVLLSPDLIEPLQQSLTTRRAEEISGNTWQAIHAPYLLKPHLVTHHGITTIYRFGHMASAVTLIRTTGTTIEPVRVGNSSLILLDQPSFDFLHMLIKKSPRNRHAAITYLKSNGLPLSGMAMNFLYRAIPKH